MEASFNHFDLKSTWGESYSKGVGNFFDSLERREAFIERGSNATCKDGSYVHGLNRVGRWPIAGGIGRILYSTLQMITGLFFGAVFGVCKLLSSKGSEWNKGHTEAASRSIKQFGHGICNFGRGIGEVIPCGSWALFSASRHDDVSSKNRWTYIWEDKNPPKGYHVI